MSDTKETIPKLLHTEKDHIKINNMNVSKQSGGADCGLYAITNIICLAQGNDDSIIECVFHQDEMWPHFKQILESGKVILFPIAKKRRIRAKILHTDVCQIYCVCRMPDNRSEMICCDQCNTWYHSSCV